MKSFLFNWEHKSCANKNLTWKSCNTTDKSCRISNKTVHDLLEFPFNDKLNWFLYEMHSGNKINRGPSLLKVNQVKLGYMKQKLSKWPDISERNKWEEKKCLVRDLKITDCIRTFTQEGQSHRLTVRKKIILQQVVVSFLPSHLLTSSLHKYDWLIVFSLL